MLPSISNLLIDTTPPCNSSSDSSNSSSRHSPPLLNLSPASPTTTTTNNNNGTIYHNYRRQYYPSSFSSTPLCSSQSPPQRLFSAKNKSNSISPLLSPISSPDAVLSEKYNHSSSSSLVLPPLEGDDPPQRLRLPSPLLSPSSSHRQRHQSSQNSLYKPSSSSWPSPQRQQTSLLLQPLQYQQTIPSINSTPSPCSFSPNTTNSITSSSSPRAYYINEDIVKVTVAASRHKTNNLVQEKVPSTQIIFDASGRPILKRRRGRPPTLRHEKDNTNQGLIFLTPTVWDVFISEEQKEREIKANDKIARQQQAQQHKNDSDEQQHSLYLAKQQNSDNVAENNAMVSFTNSSMDTLLQMPKKKRGRKPKTHIAGNSCFVWKDLTSSRTTAATATASTANNSKKQ